MALSDEQVREYIRRLLLSRVRILCNHGFYGLLLMHMTFSIDEGCETAYTDGRRIAFSPAFLEGLSDSELDFVMMHEVMHVVLQHCRRGGGFEHERYNIAADIVINSNILLENNMDLASITVPQWGVSMHIAPDGKEGHLHTTEEVYAMLPSMPDAYSGSGGPDGSCGGGMAKGRARHEKGEAGGGSGGIWDDHSHWSEFEEDDTLRDVWVRRFEDACGSIEIREASVGRGLLPAFARRMLKELRKAQTDWRTILDNFIQEEVADYSFAPPDRRFDDSPFFLPDFNGKEDMVEDILFMIDTSGSMSDDMITAAYSEVRGAIDQFDGRLRGWLGFFDAAIIEPRPFEDGESFRIIKPAGGGGTDFQIVFEYVAKHMVDKPPASIIILTDGWAPFPKEHLAMGIPVLWLLNNEKVEPPWGKVARITI